MKFSTQAAIAAISVALLASPVFAQTRTGPLPPTGSASDYQAPASGAQTTRTTKTHSKTTMHRSSTAGSELVKALQAALNAKDNANLTVDGVNGPQTRAALKKYQSANNLKATGHADAATRAKLGISSSAATTQGAARSSNMTTSPSSTTGSRAISPPAMDSGKAMPNNSGSAPNPANTPPKM